MIAKPIVLFGGEESAETIKYLLEKDAGRAIAAVTMDGSYIRDDRMFGSPVVAFEDVERDFPVDEYEMCIAMGYSRINANRKEKCLAALAKGYSLASYISSKAIVHPEFGLGWNCIIMEGCIVQPFARIGNGVTMWSGACVAHHTIIGDFCYVCSLAAVSGCAEVGERTFIGANATINDCLKIGSECVIGSGTRVTADLPDRCVIAPEHVKPWPITSDELKNI